MTGFNIRGEPWVASSKDVALRRGPMRCAWCGHVFVAGETVRCIYTNGGEESVRNINGNPLICTQCDGPREEILAKLREMREQARTKYWWFTQETR